MDPAATLSDAAELIRKGYASEAAYLLDCYDEWRKKGGFEPLSGDPARDVLRAKLKRENSNATT